MLPESMLEKIRNSRNFIELLMFSDEAIFHLDGGMNRHNFRHRATVNPHWKVEKALNSLKIMGWAAMGCTGVIGPIFFKQMLMVNPILIYYKLNSCPSSINFRIHQDSYSCKTAHLHSSQEKCAIDRMKFFLDMDRISTLSV